MTARDRAIVDLPEPEVAGALPKGRWLTLLLADALEVARIMIVAGAAGVVGSLGCVMLCHAGGGAAPGWVADLFGFSVLAVVGGCGLLAVTLTAERVMEAWR